MAFINDIYELIGDPLIESMLAIAQEAEDITGQAAEDAANATGKKDASNDIDLNTDDILGTKTPDGENTDNENEDDTPGDTGSNPNGADTEDLENAPEEGNDDQQMDDKMQEISDPFETRQKQKLWDNFRALHKSLSDSITLITKYVPNISDAPTIKALDNIKENLVDGKDYAYRVLTTEYRSLSYPEMEKKYVALNHIYDICTNELETYFDKYGKNK